MIHWLNGSVITGQLSSTPYFRATRARSPSGVCGVIRSTMLLGKLTRSAIQRASTSLRRRGEPAPAARGGAPLRGVFSARAEGEGGRSPRGPGGGCAGGEAATGRA